MSIDDGLASILINLLFIFFFYLEGLRMLSSDAVALERSRWDTHAINGAHSRVEMQANIYSGTPSTQVRRWAGSLLSTWWTPHSHNSSELKIASYFSRNLSMKNMDLFFFFFLFFLDPYSIGFIYIFHMIMSHVSFCTWNLLKFVTKSCSFWFGFMEPSFFCKKFD